MNGLTLRISTDKKSKPIKKDISKEDIFSLLPQDFSDYSLYGLEKLLSSATVEEQVKSLKEICSVFINDKSEDHEKKSKFIEMIIHLLISLQHKSPLLSPLLKFFATILQEFHSSIKNSLESQIKSRLSNPELSAKKIGNYALTLQAFLEKVPSSPCQKEMLIFAAESLKKCHTDFQVENTPVRKLKIINAIHSCVQLAISISQKYSVPEQQQLISISIGILSDPELPIDTRAAAGVLTAHLSLHYSSEHWLKVFEELLNTKNHLSILSYCSGLLTVLPSDELGKHVEVTGNKDTVTGIIYSIISNIENLNASDSGIVLSVARCMVYVTRSLIKLPSTVTEKILDSLLIYLWSHIDHYMDAVRHLALASLTNIGSVAKIYPHLGIFQLISKDLQNISVEKRSKHAAISILISHVPVEALLSQSKGLVKALFSAALGNPPTNFAIFSLENLITQDFKEQLDKNKWFEYWVNPLLAAELSSPLEQLLTTVFNIYPMSLDNVIKLGFDAKNKNIAVLLTCLKIGRKNNIIMKKDDDPLKWNGLVESSVLENCLFHHREDVRLACFALLVETSKTTEEFQPMELDLIKVFLKYNLSNQDPAVRQKSLAYCKKFLTRLRDSQAALTRQQTKNNKNQITNERISKILVHYRDTIHEIMSMCLDSLFPGASPSRRSFAFGLLALYKELGFWNNFNENIVQVLLPCLLDSYEENKLVAKQLLACLPPNILKFDNGEHVKRYIEEALLLSSSIRPPDSISAAYYMSLLTSFDGLGDKPDLICSTSYHCVNMTLQALERDLEVAKESLLKAACTGPLYGHLFVIRHILQNIYLRDVGSCPEWRSLVQKILEVAFDCNSVVAHVVYNSSPEGHLPMDFTYSLIKKESDPQVTSQMVLLCSWRTVKEVSLLLGEISEKATISDDHNENGLVSETQILAIGKHLTGLLSETKHRGAFEQAYIGFSKLASRLWRCTSGSLHGLPQTWLDETFQCIANNENLSATRRSAGIPFIVQALICSELLNGTCKSLHKTMKYLLELSKGESLEGRVHALNILRVLYRGSCLGEAVGPYVADGIATAISGFNANNWAERNSSTLLFSALMSRVFGVPRGKSETLSWRNKMTGRLFFQRYPNLYTEFLSHLEASSKSDMYPALYPVLLLLARLYPSSLEGTDSNLQLLKYLPFVMKCAESSILKTRFLAASAVSSLIASNAYLEYINQLVAMLKQVNKENHRHGILLMILKLAEQIKSLEDLKTEELKTKICTWLESLIDIIVSPKFSCTVKDTSIQIIIQFGLNYFKDISDSYKSSLENIIKKILFNVSEESRLHHYGCEMYYSRACILLMILYIKQKKINEFVLNIVRLLQTCSYDILNITLEFLNYLLVGENINFVPEMQENLKITFDDPDTISLFTKKVRNSKEIENALLEKFFHQENHHEDSVKLLKTLKFYPKIYSQPARENISVERLCVLSIDSPPTVSCQAIRCLNTFLISKVDTFVSKEDIELMSAVVHKFSEAESDVECRKAVTELLSSNFDILKHQPSQKSTLEIWTSAVRLFFDEVEDIRTMICTRIVGQYTPSKGIELLIKSFCNTNDLPTSVIGLLYWAVGDQGSLPEDVDDTMVFDKGAANTYYEDMIMNRVACTFLAELKKKQCNIKDLTFGEECSLWLFNKTNIAGNSVIDFVMKFKSSFNVHDNLVEGLPCKPNDHHSLLQMYKLSNLLKSL